jgi:uncharacterized protein (DUF169 family)
MMDLEQMHKEAEALERYMRLQTYPLAIKLLRTESDIPSEAKRPKKDENHQYNLCQTFALSRRNGDTIAMLKEDMVCFEPVVGYGLAEAPQEFMDGYNRYPEDVETQEAGKHYAEEFPKLRTGEYSGVLSAPLTKANFVPDVITLYCNSTQLVILLMAKEYRDGRNLPTALSGHAACVYGIVPAIQEKRYQVAVPCRGDHITAMAGDDEMIFTIPMERFNDFMLGMRNITETEGRLTRLPMVHEMKPEPQPPDSYYRMAQLMGMDIKKPE